MPIGPTASTSHGELPSGASACKLPTALARHTGDTTGPPAKESKASPLLDSTASVRSSESSTCHGRVNTPRHPAKRARPHLGASRSLTERIPAAYTLCERPKYTRRAGYPRQPVQTDASSTGLSLRGTPLHTPKPGRAHQQHSTRTPAPNPNAITQTPHNAEPAPQHRNLDRPHQHLTTQNPHAGPASRARAAVRMTGCLTRQPQGPNTYGKPSTARTPSQVRYNGMNPESTTLTATTRGLIDIGRRTFRQAGVNRRPPTRGMPQSIHPRRCRTTASLPADKGERS